MLGKLLGNESLRISSRMVKMRHDESELDTGATNKPNAYQHSKTRNIGLIVAGVTGTFAVAISVISASFVSPAFRRICLPFVPATSRQIDNVFKICESVCGPSTNLRHNSLVDLGSGDGRIVIEAAKRGFKATGIELNRWLVYYSKINARRLKLQDNANFERQDLWSADISKFDNIIIFGVDEMMPELERKIYDEIQPGTNVIACRFPFPNWKPIQKIEEGIDSVWLYSRIELGTDSLKFNK